GDRGGVDDRAAALALHMRDLLFHAKPHALQIDRDHAVEGFLGPIGRLLAGGLHLVRRDAGIVEGAVKPAIGRQRIVYHRAHILGARHIAGPRARRPAAGVDRRPGFRRRGRGEIRDRNARAFAGKGQGGRAADPATAAGYERDLSFDNPRHGSLAPGLIRAEKCDNTALPGCRRGNPVHSRGGGVRRGGMPGVWRSAAWLMLSAAWLMLTALIGLAQPGHAETDTLRVLRPIDLASLPLLIAEHEKLIEKQAEARGLKAPAIRWSAPGKTRPLDSLTGG